MQATNPGIEPFPHTELTHGVGTQYDKSVVAPILAELA